MVAEEERSESTGRVVGGQSENSEPFPACTRLEGTRFRADDQLFVATLAESAGQKQQLLLSPAEFHAGVEMNNL